MNNLNAWGLDSATDHDRVYEAQRLVDVVLSRARQPLMDAVPFSGETVFFEKPISPLTLMAFEIALLRIVRELGRQLLELVLNALEPNCQAKLPKDLSFECGGYRRRNQKTANRSVASRPPHRHGRIESGCCDYLASHRLWRHHGSEAAERVVEQLTELLERYHGPLPRLAYVTDSGSHETGYFQKVLRRMVHPRTGERLEWARVADYYHASERIWTMADVLFGKGTQEASAWARRMLKLLKKPSGPSRVLHSAASHFNHRQRKSKQLSQKKEAIYRTAYRYLQTRTKLMRYRDFKSVPIPLGSGVTEAACKTVFTQRLKCSGMRWSHEGAKTILTLRTILLSKR